MMMMMLMKRKRKMKTKMERKGKMETKMERKGKMERKTKMKMTVDEPPPPPIKRMMMQVSIDDYKLLVLDRSQAEFPFRTLSFDDETIPPYNPNPNPLPDGETPFITILATLDGLVCVALSWKEVPTKLVLLNPFTAACKDLPRVPFTHISPLTDPVGFYFDDSCSDYKLVCLKKSYYCGGYRTGTAAFVYSRRFDSWRIIEFPVDRPDELGRCSPAILYRQCLYFNFRCFVGFSGPRFTRIICFDVKTETFREIPVPSPPTATAAYYSFSGLIVLNGCLHLYASYEVIGDDVNNGVDLWEMMDDGMMDDDKPVDACNKWVKVDSSTVQQKKPHLIIAETAGNWLAVLDNLGYSFEKMSIEDFNTRYSCFTFADATYRCSRIIYVPTTVDP